MEHLIGNSIFVTLKNEDETLSGILIHVEEHYVYVQMENSSHFYVIPKPNVKYYVTDNIPGQSRIIGQGSPKNKGASFPDFSEKQQQSVDDVRSYLSVFVDDIHITNIDVPPTFKLHTFHDNIMKVTLGNPDVQSALMGKKQRKVEYKPGEIFIYTNYEEEDNSKQHGPNQFSMDNVSNKYMSGEQMVNILNKSVGKNK